MLPLKGGVYLKGLSDRETMLIDVPWKPVEEFSTPEVKRKPGGNLRCCTVRL